MSAIVRTEGLVKRYDRTVAVAGIDLAVVTPKTVTVKVGDQAKKKIEVTALTIDVLPAAAQFAGRVPGLRHQGAGSAQGLARAG